MALPTAMKIGFANQKTVEERICRTLGQSQISIDQMNPMNSGQRLRHEQYAE